MALIFMDGMDQYTANTDFPDKWDETHTTVADFKSGGGKFGGGAIRVHGRPYSTAPLGKLIPGIFGQATDPTDTSAASNTLFLTYWAWFNDTSAATNYHVEFRSRSDNGVAAVTIGWASDKVTIYTGTFRSLAATSVGADIATGQWVLVEVALVCGNAGVGSCEVWHDGVSMVSDSAADYAYSNAASIGSVQFGVSATATGTTGGWVDLDDVVIYDDTGTEMNTRIGIGHKIHTLSPTAEGTTNSWTPQSGTDNSAMVDESGGIDTATYVESSTAAQEDLYDVTAMSEVPTEIYGVASNIVCYEAAAGTSPRGITHRVVPVSTDRDATEQFTLPISTYYTRQAIWELNPEDSAEWEVADIDGAEFGFELST